MPAEGNPTRSLLQQHGMAVARTTALVLAAAFAYNGARILRDSSPSPVPVLDNFDEGALWLGLALLATLVATVERWRMPKFPNRAELIAFGRAHWLEIAIFAGIFAFGCFMRLFRFGETLPPSDGLCCEEHINGGTAYAALQGDRPLLFPLGRWGSAAGFLIFGENTLGLRFFFPMMSIATIALLYLLLRHLVSIPAALFGTALYAAAWWPSLRARQATEGTIYTVLLALLLVRGLQTRSPLAFFGAGIVAGLLSYEYEPFRVVPWYFALFLGAAAVREVFLRAPMRPAAARERAKSLLRSAWRPALLCIFALGIVLTPMAVGLSRGYDLYLTSVHRQEQDRGGQRLADEWRDQAKWAAELFLPFGPKDYPVTPPRDVQDTGLLDPLTSTLAILGLVAGVAFVLRGVRGLFVGWFAVNMLAGSLVLQNFAPWKFFGLVFVLIVLVAFLIDQTLDLVLRRYGAMGGRWLAVCLTIGALFSFGWNANTLFRDVGPSETIQASYGSESSLIYEQCHELRERPDGNYSYVFSSTQLVAGFAGDRSTPFYEGIAWSDYIWACHGLQGEALPAPEEAWPLRNVPPGPITLMLGNPRVDYVALERTLARAYPGFGAPTRTTIGPAESYKLHRYDLPSGTQLYQSGLSGAYFVPGAAEPSASRTDNVNGLSWGQTPAPIAEPFSVTWTGLIYTEPSFAGLLQAETAGNMTIRFDGQVLPDARSPLVNILGFPQQAAGWHTVEITLEKQQPGGNFRLFWLTGDGQQPVEASDLFPMAQITGWLHERGIGFPGSPPEIVTQRLDFSPHQALSQEARAAVDAQEALLLEERWRGVWQVETAGEYRLLLELPAGSATLSIDGQAVAVHEQGDPMQQVEVDVTLTAGPHAIALDQTYAFEPAWSGATLTAFDPSGQTIEMDVRPF